jgi:hypothetical protein
MAFLAAADYRRRQQYRSVIPSFIRRDRQHHPIGWWLHRLWNVRRWKFRHLSFESNDLENEIFGYVHACPDSRT